LIWLPPNPISPSDLLSHNFPICCFPFFRGILKCHLSEASLR
jgi:hypothetical protein